MLIKSENFVTFEYNFQIITNLLSYNYKWEGLKLKLWTMSLKPLICMYKQST